MALQISTYVDPGVYIGEVIVPGAVNIATVPLTIGIVGVGNRLKRVTNEAVQRGLVEGESLTILENTGTGDSISAPSGGIQTLTDAAASFDATVTGRQITIRNATNAANNGTFLVVGRPSATTIEYSNPSGVIEGVFPGTYVVTPHTVLANRSDRRLQTTTVFRDSKPLSDGFLSYGRAQILGTVAAEPFVLVAGVNDTISLELDGNTPFSIGFVAAGPIVTVNGTEVTINVTALPSGLTLATMTRQAVAEAINEALNPSLGPENTAMAALGYGGAYAGAARDDTTGVLIQSPISTPASDVRVFDPIAQSAVTTIFGAAGASNRDAQSVIEVQSVVFNASSTYTADYIDIEDTSDALANTGIQQLIRIGTSPGIGTFEESVDYSLTSDEVDWSLGSAAQFTASTPMTIGGTGQLDTTANDVIRLSIDGRAAVDLDLAGAATPPLSYAAPGVPTAMTAAEVAVNINALLAANANYGPRYQSVASAVVIGLDEFVRLTSPTVGDAGSITIATPTTSPANDATTTVFGLAATQLPFTEVGVGREPAAGAIYFVTYEITRPTADYNVQKRFFSEDQARSELGFAESSNPLMTAVQIAFRQGVSNVVTLQVNDSSLPGSPTRAEIAAALEATTNSDVVTEVCVLSTDLATQIDLKDHIERESAPTQKHYRRGYFGMARNTDPGDRDTPNTFVYRAARTLQVAPESPGRGRMILVAPPQRAGVSIDLTLEDGTTERVELDSTFLAVAIAAKRASFTTPAASLAKQTVGGFNVDDIDAGAIWKPAERGIMAGQGTMVVTFDAGNFSILDPVTTEAGGGGLAAFAYPITTAQKDNITRKVDRALDSNIIGVVPTDLADFIVDIKIFIAEVLQGEIGSKAIAPFRNPDNTPRRIDLTKDIEVEQDPNDPTKFFFRYFFNLRYPALRLFGEFSVDNPFFTTQAA
jgi:hypothetical protein